MNRESILRRRITMLTWVLIGGLIFSGVTALALQWEVDLLMKWFGIESQTSAAATNELTRWLLQVQDALRDSSANHPMLYYGTDWLAFGHFVIAISFIGAMRNPVRNRWLFDFGLIACAMVIPFAFAFGALRGIPIWWRLIDCSFGVFGAVPLWFCRKWVTELERGPR